CTSAPSSSRRSHALACDRLEGWPQAPCMPPSFETHCGRQERPQCSSESDSEWYPSFQALASRRESSWTLQMRTQASALPIVASKSFGETTVASKPSKGALDHPASRLGLECSHGLRSGNDFNRPLAEVGERIEQLRSAIDAVGKDMAQSREHSSDGSQQRHCTVIVLHIGSLHEHGEQRAFGIGDDVTLAAFNLLGHVKPAWAAAFRGLGTLALA